MPLIFEFNAVCAGGLRSKAKAWEALSTMRNASKIEKAETDGFRVSSRNRPVANIRVMNKPEEEVINHEIREMMRFLPYTRKG